MEGTERVTAKGGIEWLVLPSLAFLQHAKGGATTKNGTESVAKPAEPKGVHYVYRGRFAVPGWTR
jgi:hypothetical protein